MIGYLISSQKKSKLVEQRSNKAFEAIIDNIPSDFFNQCRSQLRDAIWNYFTDAKGFLPDERELLDEVRYQVALMIDEAIREKYLATHQ